MCHHRPLPQPFHLPKKKKAVKRRVKIKIIKKKKVRRHRATSCDILNVTLSTRRNKTLGEFPLPGCNCVGERYNRRGRVFHSPIHTMETVDFLLSFASHTPRLNRNWHTWGIYCVAAPLSHTHTHTYTHPARKMRVREKGTHTQAWKGCWLNGHGAIRMPGRQDWAIIQRRIANGVMSFPFGSLLLCFGAPLIRI